MNGKYIYIDVVDTAVLCNLEIQESTLHNEEVKAKCPYCKDYKYRMYLCRRPDNATFWCHNCGTGGNAVNLYKDFNPYGKTLTSKEAYEELLHEPSVKCDEFSYEIYSDAKPSIRNINERSEIYLRFLTLLDLERKHYINLHNRGMNDEIIKGNMYRSIPTDPTFRRKVIAQLESEFDLHGMPGFYTRDGKWQLANCRNSGILIPVCNKDNLIQGLQIRLDEPPPKIVTMPDGTKAEKKGERFRWLSTGGEYYQNGTAISSYIHVVGNLKSDTVYLTEGAMKADIASYLSGGKLFLGLTGVQNVRYLSGIISELRPKRIVECIDMDVRSNPHVQRAQSKIRAICMPLCDEYKPFTWPIEQKGIDDWLLFQKLKREHGLALTN